LHAQLFCAYVLGLYFTGISLPAQKLMKFDEIEPWGRFHQTFFAKQKVAGAGRLSKKLPFNFTNI
jgi:hypothetical protein